MRVREDSHYSIFYGVYRIPVNDCLWLIFSLLQILNKLQQLWSWKNICFREKLSQNLNENVMQTITYCLVEPFRLFDIFPLNYWAFACFCFSIYLCGVLGRQRYFVQYAKALIYMHSHLRCEVFPHSCVFANSLVFEKNNNRFFLT